MVCRWLTVPLLSGFLIFIEVIAVGQEHRKSKFHVVWRKNKAEIKFVGECVGGLEYVDYVDSVSSVRGGNGGGGSSGGTDGSKREIPE
ncbi:hypothetical protein M0804_005714 [Polistes exclamans]|nr:hypothetical protein M0804_005714 [Polistes exclamans]